MYIDPGPILTFPLLYLDPGSGSFLIQLLLGAGLSVAVAAKMYWSKIKGFLAGKKASPAEPSEDPDEE